MTGKKVAISAFTAAILCVVISSILHANGIHILSDNIIVGSLLYPVIALLCYLFFKRYSDK